MFVDYIKKIASYTRIEKFKQGKSCLVFPLPKNLAVVKLFYVESDAIQSWNNQWDLSLSGLAPYCLYPPEYIKLENESTGGLSGEFWYYISEYAQPIQGMNPNRVLLVTKNKLKRVTNQQFDLYTVDNVGICNGKLVLVDCLE